MKMNKLIDLNLLRQFKTNLDRKITKLDEEQDRKVEAALEEVNGRVEDLSANFTMAANSIGNVLVAKGINVPQYTTLLDMAELIKILVYPPSNKTLTGSLSDQSVSRSDISLSVNSFNGDAWFTKSGGTILCNGTCNATISLSLIQTTTYGNGGQYGICIIKKNNENIYNIAVKSGGGTNSYSGSINISLAKNDIISFYYKFIGGSGYDWGATLKNMRVSILYSVK